MLFRSKKKKPKKQKKPESPHTLGNLTTLFNDNLVKEEIKKVIKEFLEIHENIEHHAHTYGKNDCSAMRNTYKTKRPGIETVEI